MNKINLNADLGESFGAWRMGNDAEMLRLIGSANIACGFHAGDPLVMHTTLRLAKQHGVSVGAHPSFPDLQGFGRRAMQLSTAELQACVLYQVGALAALAAAEGIKLTHVKPHGALNNMACANSEMAACIARAIRMLDPDLILLAPALSELERAGKATGLPVAIEVFADRAYQADGQLMPRGHPGAVLHDAQQCVRHVLDMLDAKGIVSADGQRLPTAIHSVCVHGDGSSAVATAQALALALREAGCSLLPLPEVL